MYFDGRRLPVAIIRTAMTTDMYTTNFFIVKQGRKCMTYFSLYKKKQPLVYKVVAFEFCRGTVTRTQDPLVPNQMR